MLSAPGGSRLRNKTRLLETRCFSRVRLMRPRRPRPLYRFLPAMFRVLLPSSIPPPQLLASHFSSSHLRSSCPQSTQSEKSPSTGLSSVSCRRRGLSRPVFPFSSRLFPPRASRLCFWPVIALFALALTIQGVKQRLFCDVVLFSSPVVLCSRCLTSFRCRGWRTASRS